jgi:hypothetical protein
MRNGMNVSIDLDIHDVKRGIISIDQVCDMYVLFFKEDEIKKIIDELYTLNYQIEQLNDRIMSISTKQE